MSKDNVLLEAWDPLSSDSDPGMVIAAQRREIRNILRSYTGYFDLFSEMIQNALDAVERRIKDEGEAFGPKIWVELDVKNNSVAVCDNGCGMSETQFRQFLRPNFSFKHGSGTRGSKGVGATYLAYGFNHLEVGTKFDNKTLTGIIKSGREWIEDKTETVPRPKVEAKTIAHSEFNSLTRGTLMRVTLAGSGIRPNNLSWLGANTAEQWLTVLRAMTPLGGIYLCGEVSPNIEASIRAIQADGEASIATLKAPEYLYPSKVISRVADLRDYLSDQRSRVERGLDVSIPPPKFRSLNALWGEWTGLEIIDQKNFCPINARLEPAEVDLVRNLDLTIYIFLAFSTDLWDSYNDNTVGLRKGQRILRGGLQLSTRNMVQGLPLTIPMTNNIGFQNLAHVLVHMGNAEPDLGRKGFQPDVVRVAEKLSVSAVTALRRHYALLRKPGGAKTYDDELRLDDWKRLQTEREVSHPLIVTGPQLFLPTERLAITSEPVVEQDVVALFNQMLTSGLIRGMQVLSSSQYKQYDGLFRISMEKPFGRFILSQTNPLGLDESHFMNKEQLKTVVKILEYKYSLDGLIEEIQADVKAVEDVDLVVSWELGEKWRQMFDVTSYLDQDGVHLRNIHGATHSFTHSMNGTHAFEAIILKDLCAYLGDPQAEQVRQRAKLMNAD